ncbi:MAG TPA: PAS domain-containing protein [Polyangiaceae bacterium]|nr:PAS domain-containing protein [Polyangiaceae bacterium]
MPGATDPSGDDALLREVVSLRAQVAELQRAAARHEDTAVISLAEREELLREAERVSHLGTWTWDMGSGRVTWSDELYRILGLEPGRDTPSVEAFFSAVHPDDRARAQATSEQAIKDGVLPLVDCRIVRPDGSIRHTTSSGLYLFDTEGKARRVVGGVLDRTQSLEAEGKLRGALQLLEEAQRFAKLGSWRLDVETRALEWSAEFCRIAGLDTADTPSVEAFLGRLVLEDQARFRAAYERTLVQPEDLQIDGRLRRPDGELRHVQVNGAVLLSADGRKELRGTLLDLTDQVRLREELAQAQRAEALGRLAGGIAHDFNNLLTVVMGNLDLLADRIGRAPELEDSLRALGSAAGLTRRLLAFGRKAQLSLKLVDPNELVRSTMALMHRLVGDEVRLETELTPGLPRVRVDALEIERALVNLVINARDVMPGGGLVRIATAERRVNGLRQVELSVADEGPGVSEADLPHIFEPFYTTKRAAGGTGLGLATVLGTAEQHGGTVRVSARAGGGSIFSLILPVSERSSENPGSVRESMPARLAADGLSLLVIDDEPMVGEVTRRMLVARGHVVSVAKQPQEALAIWAERGAAIDLVICDVVMAEMRGPELVERLAEIGPQPRVLFITGYSEEAVRSELGHPVLAKPFTAAALWRALGEALGYDEMTVR